MFKRVQDRNEAELRFNELMQLADQLESKLRKIETITDAALAKAEISHSLIVVRKISEDKVNELKEILD